MSGEDTEVYTKPLRIIVLGNSSVGKTSLILRYTEDTFNTSFAVTIGLDYKVKKEVINGKNVTLQLWDTGGQERFRNITKSYYGKANGVVLVYDCTDVKSFQEIRSWITQIESHARVDIVKVLVAAKCDKEDVKVSLEMGQNLAEEYNIKFFVTSSKTGQNVNETFSYVAEEIFNNEIDLKGQKSSFVVNQATDSSETTKKKCC